jgi:UDP-3-O-[3-hydroxymyristoyl] N-acetylglucosamine deacetylase
MYQTTIRQAFFCEGTGLHSGAEVRMQALPAAAGTGIVFESICREEVFRFLPRPDAVTATDMSTRIGGGPGAISTVEHFLAAVRGCGVDNLLVRVWGGEMPILDGSSGQWLRLFKQSGLESQPLPRRILRVTRPVEVADGDRFIRAVPYKGFLVDCRIDFAHPAIGRQRLRLEMNPDSFAEIAPARTFGFLDQVEWLFSRGMAKGASLDNAVVLGPQGVINREGLRCKDEFVRHKILDFTGDMAVLRWPLQGRFVLCRSGHDLHNRFARELEAANALQEVQLPVPGQGKRKGLLSADGAWVAA